MEVEEKQRLDCGKGTLGRAGCWGAQLAGKGRQPCWDLRLVLGDHQDLGEPVTQPCLIRSGRALLAHGVTVRYPNKWIKTNKAWVQALSQTFSVLLSSVCIGLVARKWEGLE